LVFVIFVGFVPEREPSAVAAADMIRSWP